MNWGRIFRINDGTVISHESSLEGLKYERRKTSKQTKVYIPTYIFSSGTRHRRFPKPQLLLTFFSFALDNQHIINPANFFSASKKQPIAKLLLLI